MGKYGSEYFLSREPSSLEFQQRLLEQAVSLLNPLLERLRFLAIISTNLDEFFMVRVGSLHHLQRSGSKADPSGLTVRQQLAAVSQRVRELYCGMSEAYRRLCDELSEEGICIISDAARLTAAQRSFAHSYFDSAVLPLLAPTDGSAFIPGRELTMAVLFEDDSLALLPLQRLPRLIPLPDEPKVFITCEVILKASLQRLFPDKNVKGCGFFRVTRNGDFDADASRPEKLPEKLQAALKRRIRGEAVRLETEADMPDELLGRLKKLLAVGEQEVYPLDFPLDLSFLRTCLYDRLAAEPRLRYPELVPSVPSALPLIGEEGSIFDAIARGDILLHHPYQSFEPVVRLLQEAAVDPAVEIIKLTLYRLSDDSPIASALAAAALAGKRVTVFLEARARFDEENNLEHGARLAKSGCSVIYGLPHYKLHSKLLLIYRREGKLLRKYVQLGTGNYNEVTARQYTDCSLLTARPGIAADSAEFFRALEDGMRKPDMEYLTMSPFGLRERFTEELQIQQRLAEAGLPAGVFAKMNSLVDGRLCEELLRTAEAGVDVRLLVRGACCLRPQKNLRIRSVVGRFLEHSRFYCFGVGDDRRVLLSSADWMPRNMDRRVELLFPLLDRALADDLCRDMELYWSDNVRAAELCADGCYRPVLPDEGQATTDAQWALMQKYTL